MKAFKKIMLSVVFCLGLVLIMFPVKTEAAGGKYYIKSVSDLKKVSKHLNGKFYLKKNLNLKNKEWIPIGTKDKPFTGEFYGNGYTIKNLKVSKTKQYAGLFGYTEGAKISNLCVTGKVKNVEMFGGGILGLANKNSNNKKTVLSYCVSKVEVSGMDQIGGVVGRISDSEAKYCISFGNVKATGRASGGITADLYPSGNIENCLVLGDVEGGNDLTGGISGGSTEGTISGCVVIGNIKSQGSRVGVIAGDNANYAGKRILNYFLKTEDINTAFDSVEGSRVEIDSEEDEQVERIMNKVKQKVKNIN